MDQNNEIKKQSVDSLLNAVDYSDDINYIPSDFALEFINFIKLVNGSSGEENKTPVLHCKMLDKIPYGGSNLCNMLFRGSAKTTVFGEYLFLYIAVYGKLPKLGEVNLALYVSDSIENGVKNMRKNLEYRWENSEFLREYVPHIRFTDIRWEFKNKEGKLFVVKGYGAKTGVRGAKEMAQRPTLAVLDDLVSDEDARSATVIASIEDTVYKAIDYALHPTRNRIIWSGTPFNARDPLYKAIESGAWDVNVYPVCDQFPCKRAEFKSAWPDRFTYDYVMQKYNKAFKSGKLDTFNQELMLRIMSEDQRSVLDSDIIWYPRNNVLMNKQMFNFYITTDFATGKKEGNDFSVISVWAYNANGDWLWVDGVCEKQLMDKTINDLFRLAQMYNPQSVGIEVSGQQAGFIAWIRSEMMARNNYFNLASAHNSNEPGIRPNVKKEERFNLFLPRFKAHKIWFPEEMKDEPIMREAINELSLVTVTEFKSKHDDFLDTISMLAEMNPWKPSVDSPKPNDSSNSLWDDIEEETSLLDSYIV